MDAQDAYDQWHATIGELETETNALERALLGKVMCNPWLFRELSAAMRCEDFTKQAHRDVFLAMEAIRSRGQEIGLVTVKATLDAADYLDDVGGADALARLIEGVQMREDVFRHALERYAQRRTAPAN
jgi:replicative DNA helicase